MRFPNSDIGTHAVQRVITINKQETNRLLPSTPRDVASEINQANPIEETSFQHEAIKIAAVRRAKNTTVETNEWQMRLNTIDMAVHGKRATLLPGCERHCRFAPERANLDDDTIATIFCIPRKRQTFLDGNAAPIIFKKGFQIFQGQ